MATITTIPPVNDGTRMSQRAKDTGRGWLPDVRRYDVPQDEISVVRKLHYLVLGQQGRFLMRWWVVVLRPRCVVSGAAVIHAPTRIATDCIVPRSSSSSSISIVIGSIAPRAATLWWVGVWTVWFHELDASDGFVVVFAWSGSWFREGGLEHAVVW